MILSDECLAFTSALNLLAFQWSERRLVKRITLALKNGKVIHHWYPVLPSHKNMENVLEGLEVTQTKTHT